MPFFDDAANWAADAQARGYTVNMTPAVGSIWWSGTIDHVAWVEAVSDDGSNVTIQDYNYGYPSNPGQWSERTVATNSAQGYIHFKDLPTGTVVPDFTGDGRADLGWDQSGSLNVLTGQSNGTFSYGGTTSGIYASTWEGAGDFMGNGRSQIVSYSSGTGTLTVFQWNGSTWTVADQTTGIGTPSFVLVGDFDGNGHADLAWDQGGYLNLLTGQSNGTFSYGGTTSGIWVSTWQGAGGFQGNGHAQVASYSSGTGTITEFQWNGSAWNVANQTTGIGSPDFAETGDFDGNGHADLAWDQSGSLNFLTGQSNGTFSYGGTTSGIYSSNWEGAGDFLGNGHWQVGSYSSGTGTITEFQWYGSSWIEAGQTTGIGSPDFGVVGD